MGSHRPPLSRERGEQSMTLVLRCAIRGEPVRDPKELLEPGGARHGTTSGCLVAWPSVASSRVSALSWVDDGSVSYAVAGCLTLVAGLSATEALTRVGADVGLPRFGGAADVVFDGHRLISAVETEADSAHSGAVLIEDNGYEGAQPEVLCALSRKGRAASVFWNVEGVVMFSCARRGKLVCSTELPEVPDELPKALNVLVRQADDDGMSLVAVGVAMAEKFTGLTLDASPGVINPRAWYPITNPILRLRVTAEEILRLGMPTRELVTAVQDADDAARRRLAVWAVRDALDVAGTPDDELVGRLLARFERGEPTSIAPELASRNAGIERAKDAAYEEYLELDSSAGWVWRDRGLVPVTDEDRRRAEETWRALLRQRWLADAVVYLAIEDTAIAALGALYCASVHHQRDKEEFLSRAHEELTT